MDKFTKESLLMKGFLWGFFIGGVVGIIVHSLVIKGDI